eukprot:scaffold11659_cov112-Isochrysis_galbana.AAC.1
MSGGPSWSNSPAPVVRLGSVKGGKTLDFCAYIDREKMLVYDHQVVARPRLTQSGASRNPRVETSCLPLGRGRTGRLKTERLTP